MTTSSLFALRSSSAGSRSDRSASGRGDEADDLLFQQLEPLADVHLAHRVAFEAHAELAVGLIDGIDLLLQSPGAGCVPMPPRPPAQPAPWARSPATRSARETAGRQYLTRNVCGSALNPEGVSPACCGETCVENNPNASWHVRLPSHAPAPGHACIFLFIQLQRPASSTMQTPSPIVLRIRLACWLMRARSSGRKSPASEKTAAFELVALRRAVSRFVDSGNLDHFTTAPASALDNRPVGLGLTVEDEDFVWCFLQYAPHSLRTIRQAYSAGKTYVNPIVIGNKQRTLVPSNHTICTIYRFNRHDKAILDAIMLVLPDLTRT